MDTTPHKNRLIAKNLKKLRQEAGYSQSHLAALLGIRRVTYIYYELGVILPNILRLKKLADIFGVKMETFFQTDPADCLSEKREEIINGKNR